jgi:flagellar basal body-associated protein FliL
MANDSNIKIFTAADIEKYHRGQLSPKEMHELEKAALDDPFLADALEGYTVAGTDMNADIAELSKRLRDKTEEGKVIPIDGGGKSSFLWLRAAAVVIVIAGAGLLVYQFAFNNQSNNIAQTKQKENEVLKTTDSANKLPESITNDTSSGNITKTQIANDKIKPETKLFEKSKAVISEGSAKAEAVPDTIAENFANTDVNMPVATAPGKTLNKPNLDLKSDNEKEKAIAKPEEKDNVTQYNKAAADEAIAGRNAGVVLSREANANIQGYTRNNYFRGQVTDVNNNPLPFANITNTTDNVGTYSDAKGNFTLVSPDSVLDVQVRSLGFENSNIRLRKDISTNQITLKDDHSLTEVIISRKKINSSRSRDANMKFEEPEPADGWDHYDTYLANNLNTPETFETKQTGGREVEVSFEVNKDGEPVNIKVEKSLCDKCDKEAIRLVKEGPKWKRKARKGKRTSVTISF